MAYAGMLTERMSVKLDGNRDDFEHALLDLTLLHVSLGLRDLVRRPCETAKRAQWSVLFDFAEYSNPLDKSLPLLRCRPYSLRLQPQHLVHCSEYRRYVIRPCPGNFQILVLGRL